MSSYIILIKSKLEVFMKAKHNIQPIYNENSRILILGSFPSVKSREGMFFYNHPQNRFWKVTSQIFDQSEPKTIEEKKEFLLKNNIAIWDVIESCEIENSSDSTIKNAKPNDINKIIKSSKIEKIFTNGNKAHELYNKLIKNQVGLEATLLPSTSPANARFTIEELCKVWKIINSNIL